MTDVVVFSKDRPWQLSEYIRTFQTYCAGDFQIYVIYRPTAPQYDAAYQHLIKTNPTVEFVREDDSMDFNTCLNMIINEYSDGNHIMFGVDDVIFYNKFSLFAAEKALSYDYAFSYSLRLHPGITYCQPADLKNHIPPLLDHSEFDFSYNRSKGTVDWNYPWELSASVYKKSTVKDIIEQIHKTFGFDATGNPNRLEANGSIIAGRDGSTLTNFCQKKAVCSTITVNRVQEEYKNTVMNEQTTKQLLEYYWKNNQFSDISYAEKKYDSIHIGDFIIRCK